MAFQSSENGVKVLGFHQDLRWKIQDPFLPLQENTGILTGFNHSEEFLHPVKQMMVHNLVFFPLARCSAKTSQHFLKPRRKDFHSDVQES